MREEPYIRSIVIDGEHYKGYDFGEQEEVKYIPNVSSVNIFIGSNNSGKSRLMRKLMTDEEMSFNYAEDEIDDYNAVVKIINDMIMQIQLKEKSIYIMDVDAGECEFIKEIESLKINENKKKTNEGKLKELIQSIEKRNKTWLISSFRDVMNVYEKGISKRETLHFFRDMHFKKIYIPTLRGLRVLDKGHDIFKTRTEADYFGGKELGSVEIFTGQSLYDDVLNLLLSEYKDRKHLSEFEEFLGRNFFDGKEVSLIPRQGSDVLYVKIGKEKEQPIHHLGDGIQSIIILTFKLFSNKREDCLFFIEEPELYLHPGLQRKLIETFLSEEFSSYQYFITSHSNHLLDLTLDMDNISVYKFMKKIDGDCEESDGEKDACFKIEHVNDKDSSLLQLLGVNNTSVFMANCIIWVEGITDRLYIKKYLEIYQKDKNKVYTEDLHYAFLEYSGGNITHWDFLDVEDEPMKHTSICNNIILIADDDNAKDDSKKKERFETLKSILGKRFYKLEVKEIENILTPEIIKKTVTKFKDKRFKEKRSVCDIFSECQFSQGDYKTVNLGEFIEREIEKKIETSGMKLDEISIKKFKKGNTISDKVKFCKYAIEDINTIDDMSQDAKDLCAKIYGFIESCNAH